LVTYWIAYNLCNLQLLTTGNTLYTLFIFGLIDIYPCNVKQVDLPVIFFFEITPLQNLFVDLPPSFADVAGKKSSFLLTWQSTLLTWRLTFCLPRQQKGVNKIKNILQGVISKIKIIGGK
jgi:hypothetical protein